MQNTSGRGGGYQYDIHFWIGKDTCQVFIHYLLTLKLNSYKIFYYLRLIWQDDAKSASVKAVELDTVLGGHAVHHQEIQGFESDRFLSYFKPCFIPLVGGYTSGSENVEENFETRLYVSKGKRVVRLKQVYFNW